MMNVACLWCSCQAVDSRGIHYPSIPWANVVVVVVVDVIVTVPDLGGGILQSLG